MCWPWICHCKKKIESKCQVNPFFLTSRDFSRQLPGTKSWPGDYKAFLDWCLRWSAWNTWRVLPTIWPRPGNTSISDSAVTGAVITCEVDWTAPFWTVWTVFQPRVLHICRKLIQSTWTCSANLCPVMPHAPCPVSLLTRLECSDTVLLVASVASHPPLDRVFLSLPREHSVNLLRYTYLCGAAWLGSPYSGGCVAQLEKLTFTTTKSAWINDDWSVYLLHVTTGLQSQVKLVKLAGWSSPSIRNSVNFLLPWSSSAKFCSEREGPRGALEQREDRLRCSDNLERSFGYILCLLCDCMNGLSQTWVYRIPLEKSLAMAFLAIYIILLQLLRRQHDSHRTHTELTYIELT